MRLFCRPVPCAGSAWLQKAPEAELCEAALSPAAHPSHRSLSCLRVLAAAQRLCTNPGPQRRAHILGAGLRETPWSPVSPKSAGWGGIVLVSRTLETLSECVWQRLCRAWSLVHQIPSEQCLDWCLTRAGHHGPARLTHVQLITVDSGLHPFLSTCPVPPWLLPLHVLCAPVQMAFLGLWGQCGGQGGCLGVHAAHV